MFKSRVIQYSIVFTCLILMVNNTHSNSIFSPNQQEFNIQDLFYDLSAFPDPLFVVDNYPNNTIEFASTCMVSNASAHTCSHIQRQYTDFAVLSIETNISLISGEFGASWGPGLGIWWDSENNVQFNFDGNLVRYVAVNENVTTSSRLMLNSTYTSIQLKIDFAVDSKIQLSYKVNNTSWESYWDGSIINEIGNGNSTSTFNHALDTNSDPLIMVGKGLSSSLISEFPATLSPGEEFNSHYIPETGGKGIINYHYISIQLRSSVSTESSDTGSSNTPTDNNTSISSIPSSNTENETDNTLDSFSTPNLPVPFPTLFVIIGLLTLRAIRKRKHYN